MKNLPKSMESAQIGVPFTKLAIGDLCTIFDCAMGWIC